MKEVIKKTIRDIQYLWTYASAYDPSTIRRVYDQGGFKVASVESDGDLVSSVEISDGDGNEYKVVSRGPKTPPDVAVPEGVDVGEDEADLPQAPPPDREHVCSNCAHWSRCGNDYQWNGEDTGSLKSILDFEAAGECRSEAPIIHQSALIQGPVATWPITHES